MAFIEKRAFRRLLFNVEVEYKVVSAPEELSALMVHSKNISAGGIRLVILEKLDLGTILALKFFLPDSTKPTCATGRVVWTEEYTIGTLDSSKAYDAGIEFVSIKQEDRARIHNYVHSRS